MLHKLRLTGRDGLFQKVGIFANVPVEHRLIAEHLNKDGFGLLDLFEGVRSAPSGTAEGVGFPFGMDSALALPMLPAFPEHV